MTLTGAGALGLDAAATTCPGEPVIWQGQKKRSNKSHGEEGFPSPPGGVRLQAHAEVLSLLFSIHDPFDD